LRVTRIFDAIDEDVALVDAGLFHRRVIGVLAAAQGEQGEAGDQQAAHGQVPYPTGAL